MFHESLTAHASKTDDSCAYCTGYGKKSALKEMLCSKAKSQKFNAKSMISNMISKWFLKKSLKSSTISLSNFPKFFYSKKKKKSENDSYSFFLLYTSLSPQKFIYKTLLHLPKKEPIPRIPWMEKKKKKKTPEHSHDGSPCPRFGNVASVIVSTKSTDPFEITARHAPWGVVGRHKAQKEW